MAIVGVMLLAGVAGAEETAELATPCSTPEARQFDFWLGEWKLTWEDGHGTNHITAILDDCVIQEDFTGHMADGTVFRGKSVSSYNTRLGTWRQTWVDNAGGYLDFDGGWVDGKMVFTREAPHPEKPFLQRMVWYHITDDALDWNWERSDDGGATWQVQWQIRYERQAQR